MTENKTPISNNLKEKMNKYEYSVADARDTLDRIIAFVCNCDTKASVVLGVVGIILTIIITDSTISKFISMIKEASNSGTLVSVSFLTLLVIVVGVLAFGTLKLVSVLIAKISPSKHNSKIYFADIASNKDSYIYEEKVLNQSERDVLDDLIAQIYINSTICNKKFKRYNLGLKCILISAGLFILMFIIGVIFVYDRR